MLRNTLARLARYRKGLVVAATGLAWLVGHGYLHGTALTDANAALWLLSTAGVIAVPNAPADLTEHPTGQHTA
jgi:hypothetical protein